MTGSPVAVLVTVADDRADDIAALADRMRATGMTVDAVLASIGVVTGSATPAQAIAVARLPGVTAVERDRPVQLPPPDPDVPSGPPDPDPPTDGSAIRGGSEEAPPDTDQEPS